MHVLEGISLRPKLGHLSIVHQLVEKLVHVVLGGATHGGSQRGCCSLKAG